MRMTRKNLQKGAGATRGYLDGQMLIATPTMQDERFARSVIYICAHSSEGAMGIVVNQPAAHISFKDLLVKLNVIPAADLIQLPGRAGGVKVYRKVKEAHATRLEQRMKDIDDGGSPEDFGQQ